MSGLVRRPFGAAALGALAVFAPLAAGAQGFEIYPAPGGRQPSAALLQRLRRQTERAAPRASVHPDGSGVRADITQRGGTLPVVVLPALFSGSATPLASISEGALREVFFTGPSEFGTLTALYDEMSRGALDVTGVVSPWVRTSLSIEEVVGTSFGLEVGYARTGEFVAQAAALADPAIDYAQFDDDGPDGIANSGDDDGVVDAVAVLFEEGAASCGGPSVWPHAYAISGWTGAPYVTGDVGAGGQPIVVDRYVIQGATLCGGPSITSVSTIAHELGHVLGLPDLYDLSDGLGALDRKWVLGCFDLMAGGAWGCEDGSGANAGRRPPHMSPWSKEQLGWLTPEVVGDVTDVEYTLEPVETGGKVLRVPAGPGEYFEVEYRRKAGFDADLPASGVLVYHVDETRPFQVCRSCGPRIYRVMIAEADADESLTHSLREGGNIGEEGDMWGINGKVTLSSATTPSTRTNAGAAPPITFSSITVDPSGNFARVRLTTTIAVERLVQFFIGGAAAPLTPEEQAYFDLVGNHNGRYDVGDLRAYLTAHPEPR